MMTNTRWLLAPILVCLGLSQDVRSQDSAAPVDLTPYLVQPKAEESGPSGFQLAFIGEASHRLQFRYGTKEAVELQVSVGYPAGGARTLRRLLEPGSEATQFSFDVGPLLAHGPWRPIPAYTRKGPPGAELASPAHRLVGRYPGPGQIPGDRHGEAGPGRPHPVHDRPAAPCTDLGRSGSGPSGLHRRRRGRGGALAGEGRTGRGTAGGGGSRGSPNRTPEILLQAGSSHARQDPGGVRPDRPGVGDLSRPGPAPH